MVNNAEGAGADTRYPRPMLPGGLVISLLIMIGLYNMKEWNLSQSLNTDFAKVLLKELKKPEYQAPEVNINAVPLMNIDKIRRLLPHRPPFLLVDKILSKKGNEIIGLKMCL